MLLLRLPRLLLLPLVLVLLLLPLLLLLLLLLLPPPPPRVKEPLVESGTQRPPYFTLYMVTNQSAASGEWHPASHRLSRLPPFALSDADTAFSNANTPFFNALIIQQEYFFHATTPSLSQPRPP